MSNALEDDITFTFGEVVEFARGMTDEEAYHYLMTGELPVEDDVEPDVVSTGFDEDEPRDAHGRWTKTPGHGPADVVDDLAARESMIEAALHSPQAKYTDKTHQLAPGVWSPERDKIHREIVDDVYGRASQVPNDGHAIILGGPPGAGKSSTLRASTDVDPGDYLVINPDDMKEELARRGLIPEIPGYDLSPLERSSLVHAESMRLARMLADRAYRDRKNVIWDTTMSWHSVTASHVKALREADYKRIDAIVIDVAEDVRKQRVASRYAIEQRKHQQGKGLGGRYVPRAVMRDQHDSHGHSYARGVLKGMRDDFDGWVIFDNSQEGTPPRRVDGKGDIS